MDQYPISFLRCLHSKLRFFFQRIVEKQEFIAAIKGSRLSELSMTVLLEQMDGHLEGLEEFFQNYQRRAEEAKSAAQAEMDINTAAYERFQATAKR